MARGDPWRDTWGEQMDEGISDSTHGMLAALAVLVIVALLVWSCAGGGLG